MMPLIADERSGAAPIATLEELARILDGVLLPEAYGTAMQRVAISPAVLEPLCLWNPRQYSRQCLHRTHSHELLLICYEPGQRTSIHDYDSQSAWIKPVLGQVVEERFGLAPDGSLVRQGMQVLSTGRLEHLGGEGVIHRHSNPGPGRAITLNLYARPIRRWRVYDERTGSSSLSGTPDAASE